MFFRGAAVYNGGIAAMGKINREDMLELTRRMTLKRNCFDRIAGAYLDEEGFVDGTFNRHFLKLSQKEQQANLGIAKAIPFSDTNVQLREYVFGEADRRQGGIWQLLMALNGCGLKNDAILDTFYEEFGRRYRTDKSYAIYFFHGSYDVPLKAGDKESLWESEEVYQFLVCAVCPVNSDYEPGKPEWGFLFPAFKDRSSDTDRINVFAADGKLGNESGVEEVLYFRK